MSVFINVICFVGGACFGLVTASILVAAGRADEQSGAK